MSQPIIKTSGLNYAIGKRPILKSINVSVTQGQYVTLAGPNGAGKTTLLKCLGGIIGRKLNVEVCGHALWRYSRKALARLISYVPQYSVWDGSFNVYDFVMLGRYPYLQFFGAASREDKDVVARMLEFTGLTDLAQNYLTNLSGGERQKVFIAAALAQKTRVLLLDEPTTFLDPKHESEIMDLVFRINREYGVTVISVTHDINNAAASADRVIAMKNGQIVFDGATRAFMRNEVLEQVYDKRFLFAQHPCSDIPVVVPGKADVL